MLAHQRVNSTESKVKLSFSELKKAKLELRNRFSQLLTISLSRCRFSLSRSQFFGDDGGEVASQ